MNHVGVIVDDLPGAIAFFVDLGLELSGQMQMEDPVVDRLLALEGVRTEFAFVRTPDGSGQFELIKFLTPVNQPGSSDAPANALGLRHVAFEVENIDAVVAGLQARGVELVGELVQYEESWKLCYVRGPEGIIVELAEQIG
jgi:catechol 2,3-dioxygenase-like lactoylglutathione lyase family enzyme